MDGTDGMEKVVGALLRVVSKKGDRPRWLPAVQSKAFDSNVKQIGEVEVLDAVSRASSTSGGGISVLRDEVHREAERQRADWASKVARRCANLAARTNDCVPNSHALHTLHSTLRNEGEGLEEESKIAKDAVYLPPCALDSLILRTAFRRALDVGPSRIRAGLQADQAERSFAPESQRALLNSVADRACGGSSASEMVVTPFDAYTHRRHLVETRVLPATMGSAEVCSVQMAPVSIIDMSLIRLPVEPAQTEPPDAKRLPVWAQRGPAARDALRSRTERRFRLEVEPSMPLHLLRQMHPVERGAPAINRAATTAAWLFVVDLALKSRPLSLGGAMS